MAMQPIMYAVDAFSVNISIYYSLGNTGMNL